MFAAAILLMAQSASDLPSPEEHAIAQHYSQTFLICGEEHPDVGDGFELCEAQELVRQRAALARAFQATTARKPGPEKANLQNSERRWSVESAAACHAKVASKAIDDTFDGCMINETIRRTIWLEKLR